MSRHRKLCRDKVEVLKVKMLVVTKKFMSLQFPEAEKHERAGCNKFYVATQDNLVATRTKLLHQNYVATLSKFAAIESKEKLKESIVTKTKNSVVT